METTGDHYPTPGGEGSARPESGDLPFSRNLELKASGETAGSQRPAAEWAVLPLDQEEKQTYFQVEAGKIIDILGEELERLGSSRETLELVEEIFSSWLALWGEEKHQPVTYFTDMFEVARDVFRQAGRLGRTGLTAPERLTMSRLLQGMRGLVQGEGNREYYDWCRETANRCTRMVIAWSTRTETPTAKPSADTPEKPVVAGREDELDISKSVDEWFVQVSRLVKGPTGGGKPPQSEAEGKVKGPRRPEMVSAGKGEESAPEKDSKAERKLTHWPVEPAGREERTVMVGKATPAAGPPASRPVPAAGPEAEPEAASIESPSALREELPAEPEGKPSGGHLAEAYFVERCREALELIRVNLDKLAGPSTHKVSRLLDNCVGQVAELAQDFGIKDVDETLEALQKNLNHIVIATDRGEPTGRAEIEALRSAVSSLERDCQLLDCVA